LDATLKLILERYDALLSDNLKRLQTRLNENEQAALLLERKTLLARRQEVKQEFANVAKFWLY
jgi:hypothetical protein